MTDKSSCAAPITDTLAPPATDSKPGILVVDDDHVLLSLLRTVFLRRGFEVWTAPDGWSALETYRQHQSAIAVALLDVCMPGMDGPHLIVELRRVNPAVRACFMSGFLGKYTRDDLLSRGAQHFVEKPFEIVSLAEMMWQLAHGETRQSA
jgi:CheY-like chemotaxis protein